MNNQDLMMKRDSKGLTDSRSELEAQLNRQRLEDEAMINSFEAVNNGMMVRRDAMIAAPANAAPEKAFPDDGAFEEAAAPDKDFGAETPIPAQGAAASATRPAAAKADPSKVAQAMQAAPAKLAATQSTEAKAAAAAADIAGMAAKAKAATGAKAQALAASAKAPAPAAKSAEKLSEQGGPAAPKGPDKIKASAKPDDLAKAYIDMFRKHFDLELSTALVFDNMRRFVSVDNVKSPEKTLYFIENTYRISTLLYLSSNLPIMIVATVLNEKNRKSVMGYITTEVENAAKPYEDVKALRMRRYMRKYENMRPNDAPTVTLGVTEPTKELTATLLSRFDDMCRKMKKLDKELERNIAKMDDEARNDVAYIYSNCWYFLQSFENVPEMRSYAMSITDNTRKNMKL